MCFNSQVQIFDLVISYPPSHKMLLIGVLIITTIIVDLSGGTTLLLLPQNLTSKEDEFVEVLQSIKDQRNFESLLILRRHAADCFVPLCNLYPEVPKFVLKPGEIVALKHSFNSELIALVCMKSAYDDDILKALKRNLFHMRQSRVIFLLKDFPNVTAITRSIFEYSLEQNMINVLSFFEDYQETNVFHRLMPFPELQLQELVVKSVGPTEPFFPRHWRNMHGKSVLTLPDQIEPRSFAYVDRMGKQKLSGYVTKLVMLFANKYNATLHYLHELKVGGSIHMTELRKSTLNNTLDLGISLTVAGKMQDDFLSLSYPVELGKWMLMVPTAEELPTSDIFFVIMGRKFLPLLLLLALCFSALLTSVGYRDQGQFNLIDLFLNADVLRGILGQSSDWHHSPRLLLKFLYFLIFLSGLIFCTTYGAHLQTLLTSRPTWNEVSNVADIRSSNLKILIGDSEQRMLRRVSEPEFMDNIASSSEIIPYLEFLDFRRKMDTSYAYPVTTSVWPILDLQQEFYSRKIFHIPELLTIAELIFAIPLQLNSVYKEPLDALVHQVHEAGLTQYWYTLTFFEMVEAGFVTFSDINHKSEVDPIRANDLQWVWLLLVVGWMLAVITYFGETVMHFWVTRYQGRRRRGQRNELLKRIASESKEFVK